MDMILTLVTLWLLWLAAGLVAEGWREWREAETRDGFDVTPDHRLLDALHAAEHRAAPQRVWPVVR